MAKQYDAAAVNAAVNAAYAARRASRKEALAVAKGTVSGSILREAAEAVDGPREDTHGDKERSFVAIADMWTAYLVNRREPGSAVRPHDVAHMMVLLKQQRAEHGGAVRDHFVDAAGYSAIAGELALPK